MTTSISPLTLENDFVPLCYDLKLTVNHLKPNFQGEVTIDLKKQETSSNQERKSHQFKLHAHRIIIIQAKLSSQNRSYDLKVAYDRQNQEVILSSNESLVFEESKLTLTYMGQIKTIKTFQDYTNGLFKTNYLDNISGRSDNYVLATHTQPYSARQIFPLVDELYSKVPIKLSIETKSTFKVVSNALLKAEPKVIPFTDRAVFEFKETPPIASSVFGFVIGDFEFSENHELGLPLRVYTPIGEGSYGMRSLALLKEYIPVMENLFATKYPLDKLDLIALPFLSDGAMENWGMITVISSQIVLDLKSGESQTGKDLKQLVAHELVHQWIGNLITFDDWSSLWFNEAFATFLGNYVVSLVDEESTDDYEIECINEMERLMERDIYDDDSNPLIIPIADFVSQVNTSLSACTSSLFDTDVYHKGLILLRSIGRIMQNDNIGDESHGEKYSCILAGFQKLLQHFKYRTLKTLDVWSFLDSLTSFELKDFIFSYLKSSSYPYLRIECNEKGLHVERLGISDDSHKFLTTLFIKTKNQVGTIMTNKHLISERSAQIDVPLKKLVTINYGKLGYYRAVLSEEVMSQVANSIRYNEQSPADIISLLHDSFKLQASSNPTVQKESLLNFFSILSAFVHKDWQVNFRVLKVALVYLESVSLTLFHYSTAKTYHAWLTKYIRKLFGKVGSWDQLNNLQVDYDRYEIFVRNFILQLSYDSEETVALAKKLFKNFANPKTNSFMPLELLPCIFNSYIYGANQREYKKVLELVRNSNTSILRRTNAKANEIQTIALTSLAFTEKPELLSKTLNFVTSNIDAKAIGLALAGFQYKCTKSQALILFEWFKMHYDSWALKSSRMGSSTGKQIKATLQHISQDVFFLMSHDEDLLELKNEFIKRKLRTLPVHGLEELLEESQQSVSLKTSIGNIYNSIADAINIWIENIV